MSAEEQFLNAVINISIFGDKRDATIAKWNHLQAIWGVDMAFYSQNQLPTEINQQNLCRLKTMANSKLSESDNKGGLISIIFNKIAAQVKDLQQQPVIKTLNQVFWNKLTLSINIDNTKSSLDIKLQLIFYVHEKFQSYETRNTPSQGVYNFINSQALSKHKFTNMGVDNIFPCVAPGEDQFKKYLQHPPKRIDRRMWNQTKKDNPDREKFVSIPMVGFHDFKWRIKCQ